MDRLDELAEFGFFTLGQRGAARWSGQFKEPGHLRLPAVGQNGRQGDPVLGAFELHIGGHEVTDRQV